jgi:kynurenine 3-monooxygenase
MQPQALTIVGAGLGGSLLALALSRRGFRITLYDRRPDPRLSAAERGRSINLALANRGIRALERCGVMAAVQPLLIRMRGRMVHELGTGASLFRYGQGDHEVIHSVSRAALNRVLIDAAERGGVTLRFSQACVGLDTRADVLRLRDTVTESDYEVPLASTIGADGTGSVIRAHLAESGVGQSREERLDHDYKELTLPSIGGRFALEPHALHIWPRRGFMLIALPNLDASFTATLFLAREGADSFATLASPAAVQKFFAAHFPDLIPLMPDLLADFAQNPQGQLSTVHVSRWHDGGRVLLLGDAAHAIVPFHGQGMNAAFEDCASFEDLLDRHHQWGDLFAEFEKIRRPNTEAIAKMALENYIEMRDTVLNPKFRRLKSISSELEVRFPDRFVPRYSMIMFHTEISYEEALKRGATQAAILEELDARRTESGEIDPALAERLVHARLPVIAARV